MLLRSAFPDVFSDAELFIQEFGNTLPWDFALAFRNDGTLGKLTQQYGVESSRHRHSRSSVSPTPGLGGATPAGLVRRAAAAGSQPRPGPG